MCDDTVILHERGLTLSSAAFPRPGRRNGERIDCMVPGVRSRSATSSTSSLDPSRSFLDGVAGG